MHTINDPLRNVKHISRAFANHLYYDGFQTIKDLKDFNKIHYKYFLKAGHKKKMLNILVETAAIYTDNQWAREECLHKPEVYKHYNYYLQHGTKFRYLPKGRQAVPAQR